MKKTQIFSILFTSAFIIFLACNAKPLAPQFDGQRAMDDAVYQVSLGPRTPGSPGHAEIITWIENELDHAGWEHQIQQGELLGHKIENIVGMRGQGSPWIILGAHYDTRFFADNDPNPANHQIPVPGANDGASGVAVLLELARTIPDDFPGKIWLVFFDTEDNGNIPAWDWILGSRYFVENLDGKPDAVVIVDMIGDADLNIYMEKYSDEQLTAEIWEVAATLGYADQFIPTPKYRMLDDHLPFIQAGIPAVDLIDFDYPFWHTVNDTLDKLSAKSLQAVGDTLLAWLSSFKG